MFRHTKIEKLCNLLLKKMKSFTQNQNMTGYGDTLLLNELTGIRLRRLIITVAVHQGISNNFRVGISIHAV